MKTTKFWMMLMTAVLALGMVGCSDAEEGEDHSTWVTRNMLDGGWTLSGVKVNGQYEWGTTFYMEMNLRAEGRKFEALRFYYKNNRKDDSTEVIKTGTFTIEGNSDVIVATADDGTKFFRMKLSEEVSSSLVGTITFYDINKTYDVAFGRAANVKIK